MGYSPYGQRPLACRLGSGSGCVLDRAARRLDGGARTLGRRHALERHGPLDLTRQHHLGALGVGPDDPGLLQRLQIHHRTLDLGELMQAHFGAARLDVGAEADLRHAALHRHLAALEADLVVAALAGALALGAAAAGLALAGGGAAADAQAWPLGPRGRFQCIQSHSSQAPFSSTRNRCTAVWIMPRFSRVSLTVTLWRMRRSPRPR